MSTTKFFILSGTTDELTAKNVDLKEKNKDLLTENKSLVELKLQLKNELTTLGSRIIDLEEEKKQLIEELSETTAKLENQQIITQDLLDQLSGEIEQASPKYKVLLMMDRTRISIQPFIQGGKYDYTICDMTDSIEDIQMMMEEQNHIDELRKYDMVVLAAGKENLMKGVTGLTCARDIIQLANSMTDIGMQVTILAIPPMKFKLGQKLLCNTTLSKQSNENIQYIPLDEMDIPGVLQADNTTLTPEAAKQLMCIINKKLKVNKKPEIKEVPVLNIERKVNENSKANVEVRMPPNVNRGSGPTADDREETEDVIQLTKAEKGKIIGLGGNRIKTLRKISGANIYVEDIEKNGEEMGLAIIKGETECVRVARREILQILKEKPGRGLKTTGNSPLAKKQRK